MVYLGNNFDPNYKQRLQTTPGGQARPSEYRQAGTSGQAPNNRYANRSQEEPFSGAEPREEAITQYPVEQRAPYIPNFQAQQEFQQPLQATKMLLTENETYLAASNGKDLSAFATVDNQIHIVETSPLKNMANQRYKGQVNLQLVKIVQLTSDKAPMHLFEIEFVSNTGSGPESTFLVVCTTVGIIFLYIEKAAPVDQGLANGTSTYSVEVCSTKVLSTAPELTKYMVLRDINFEHNYNFHYTAVEGDVYFDISGRQIFGTNYVREYITAFNHLDKSLNEMRELSCLELEGRVCCITAGALVLQEVVDGHVVNRLLILDQDFSVTRAYALDDICYDFVCCFEQYICLTSFQGFGCLVSRANGEIKYFARMGQLIYKEQLIRIPATAQPLDSITWMSKESENGVLISTSAGALLKIVFQLGEVMLVQDITEYEYEYNNSLNAFSGSEMTCFCQTSECVCCGFGGGADGQADGAGFSGSVDHTGSVKRAQRRSGILAAVRLDNQQGQSVCEVVHV